MRNDVSCFASLTVSATGIDRVQLIPVHIQDHQVNIAAVRDAAWMYHKVRTRSKAFDEPLLDNATTQLTSNIASSKHRAVS
jgi:hypothetical protein